MRSVPVAALLAAVSCACSGGSRDGAEPAERPHTASTAALQVDGQEAPVPLERFRLYLVEDEETAPEVFELTGPGVALVGELPTDLRVGNGNDWQQVVGRSISVLPAGGDPGSPKRSHITPPGGAALTVLGGTLTVERLSDSSGGPGADCTLHGRASLRVQTPGGEKRLEGTFAVPAVTLG